MEQKPKEIRWVWVAILVAYALTAVFFPFFFSRSITADFRRHMDRQRQNSLSRMVQLAYNTTEPLVEQLRQGTISRELATQHICDLVRGMTYQDEFGPNYIFMSSYDGIMLVQPYEPEKEGTDQWLLQDPSGRYIIQELIRAAQAHPEGSFVTYAYYLPDQSGVEHKLSFVMGIPEIEAYIGTGMYVESSYQALESILRQQRMGYLSMALFFLASLVVYVLVLLRSNRRLGQEVRERTYAENNLWTVLNTIHDAIIIHDNQGQLLYTNQQAAILYGMAPEEMLQYTISHLSADPTAAATFHQDINDQIRRNGFIVFEWKARRPGDNSHFDVEVALRKVHWSGKEVFVGGIRDITEQKRYVEKVRHLAYFDSLTGLPNRTYIMNELQKWLDCCSGSPSCGAVFFIDVDNFKVANDTHGHVFGDQLLVEIARRLETLCSPSLILSRLGGDEFLILATDLRGGDLVRALGDQILALFHEPITVLDTSCHITCSIGVACYPQDGHTVREILQHADLAMYRAKNLGRSQYVLFDRSLSIEFSQRTRLEQRLKEAYRDREFLLHYQPQVDVSSGRIVGAEALLRWDDGSGELRLPRTFISMAEETGLINNIGQWVIEESFAFAQQLMDQGICVSCNVSPVQLRQPDFVAHVTAAFDRRGLGVGSVALEITESCLVESFGETYAKLAALRAHGILIYLDDFGTGYSSLNYMKSLPIDVLKIDKSFVDNITADGVEGQIVKTIVTLARDIGLRVIAEGVEQQEQQAYLASCGCTAIQGYLFSPPMAGDALLELMDQNPTAPLLYT